MGTTLTQNLGSDLSRLALNPMAPGGSRVLIAFPVTGPGTQVMGTWAGHPGGQGRLSLEQLGLGRCAQHLAGAGLQVCRVHARTDRPSS